MFAALTAMGRKRRGRSRKVEERRSEAEEPQAPATCWLCGRPLGGRIEWHHPWPKSRGGRDTVPVHPICHRTIHACFTNKELETFVEDGRPLGDQPEMARFLGWIATKPPDFSAPTKRRR